MVSVSNLVPGVRNQVDVAGRAVRRQALHQVVRRTVPPTSAHDDAARQRRAWLLIQVLEQLIDGAEDVLAHADGSPRFDDECRVANLVRRKDAGILVQGAVANSKYS